MSKLRLIKAIVFLNFLVNNAPQCQVCNCKEQLYNTIQYIETNHPAYQKVKKSKICLKQYVSKKDSFILLSSTANEKQSCLLLLQQYLKTIKDHHTSIQPKLNRIDIKNKQAIDSFIQTSFYKSFKLVDIDTTKWLNESSIKSSALPLGVCSNGGKLIFALVPSNIENKYLGVVLKPTTFLKTGHVILELTKTNNEKYICRYNLGVLGFDTPFVDSEEGDLHQVLANFGMAYVDDNNVTKQKEYDFYEVNDSVNYLRLTSFDHKLLSELNRFYDSISAFITNKPSLIIDLRNNGGGDERCYFNLMKFIYTNPLKVDQAYVFVTNDNIKSYEKLENYDAELIKRMKESKRNSFISLSKNNSAEWIINNASIRPEKIVLLYNKATASSAESMITYCIQSKKITTMGERSGGYTGYGNVMNVDLPGGEFTLNTTTTAYKNNQQYEYVGIKPMVNLSNSDNWIDSALSSLKK